jgi:FHS family L-fucose permease-like MFS transporter
MSETKKGLFVVNGQSLAFTFALVSSLFFVWALCNGMIDVMDKHFQEELSLTKSQSAWVQFAHYLGYFLMSIPAGALATKLGYKRGIIVGLLIVAVGGFWFIPATHISELSRSGSVSPTTAFIGFLAGVCAIATGLTFLETIANPYTTVLGDPRYAATRINLAQSCNGLGWVFGPPLGGVFFYSKNSLGQSTGNQTLFIPYVGVAVVAIVLAVVFGFANVPDIKTEDDYHVDEQNGSEDAGTDDREIDRPLVYLFLLLNVALLVGAIAMIIWAILGSLKVDQNTMIEALFAGCSAALLVAAAKLVGVTKRITRHSAWAHPHFSSATVAQFFYVAAQAGIFSFFINYMTAETPAIPARWGAPEFLFGWVHSWLEIGKSGALVLSDKGAANLASAAFICFLIGRFTGAALLRRYSAHKMLGLYALLNVFVCLLVFCKLGWLSVICVFLSYFFMSIMFPTIFALGIFGLGSRAKKASSFIVMAIMGGAILPKVMGAVADKWDMSRGFIVPLFCFVIIALYGFNWSRFSKADSLHPPSLAGH